MKLNLNILAYFIIATIMAGRVFFTHAYAQSAAVPPTSSDPLPSALPAEDSTESWKGSIMFSEKTIANIYAAIRSYQEKIPLSILIPDLFDPIKIEESLKKSQPVQPVSPQPIAVQEDILSDIIAPTFYLNSILYVTQNEWSLWINGEKLTPKTSEHRLIPLRVTPDYAGFLWRDVPLGRYAPDWKTLFSPLDGRQGFRSNRNNIIIHEESDDIFFILRPNQTLLAKNFTIIEGNFIKRDKTSSSEVNPRGRQRQDITGSLPNDDNTLDTDPQPRNNPEQLELLRKIMQEELDSPVLSQQ